MNDSSPPHFHRGLFSRLKRVKTQPSTGSSGNQSTLSEASSAMSTSQQVDELDSSLADRPRGESSERPVEAETQDQEQDNSLPGEGELNSGDTAAGAHEAAARRLQQEKCHDEPHKQSRKSRAIQLFRRAAAGIRSSSDSISTARHTVTSQQQPDDEAEPHQQRAGHQPARSNRLASLALRLNSSLNHSSSVSSNLNGAGSSSRRDTACSTADEHHPAAGFLPRFIVPKTNALNLPIVCLIKSLDGELMREISIHRYELGQYLVDNLKASLGFRDSKYFGLRLAKCADDQEDVRQPWLELNEPVYKQISKHKQLVAQERRAPAGAGQCKSVELYLRIKYYPPNLTRVQDPFLRQYLWLQLKRDLRLGKLTSSMSNLTLLMACVLQHQFGDYQPELVDRLPELVILPNQDLIEEQALEYWRTKLAGCKRHQVQMQFLRAAIILETYGFDYYPVRDHQRQRAYLLGFNYNGIKTIRNGRIVHHFRWHSLSTISHERRMIIFHIYPTENSKRKQILGFKCLSNDDCQTLYMRVLEQRYFFTVDLAYFDKSIRRPSCLESSQLDWPTTAAPGASSMSINSAGQQHELPGGDSFDSQQDQEDEFDGFDHAASYDVAAESGGARVADDKQPEQQQQQPPTNRRTRLLKRPLPNGQQPSSNSSTNSGSAPFSQQPANNCGADSCSDCKRYETAHQPSALVGQFRVRAHPLEKSASLQESNPLDPLSCRAPQSSLSFAAPDPMFGACSSVSYCSDLNNQQCLATSSATFVGSPSPDQVDQPSGGAADHFGHAPPLRRQLSQYSSCNLAHEHAFSPPLPLERRAPDDDELMFQQTTCVNSIGAQQRRQTTPSVVHQLADLANWLLLPWRPAQFIGSAFDWAQDDEHRRRQSAGGSLMPAVRLCLIILLMNFLIRLTDNLTSNLVELLSFGADKQPPAAARATLFGAGHSGT